jgi:serine/threonine protein kinase
MSGETEHERRLQSIFFAVAELPPGERGGLLEELCAGDDGLRAAVEERLRLDAETLDRLGAVLAPAGAGEPGEFGAEVGGERSYRLIRELGRGGMGAVWLAERMGGEFRQRVAIKLLAAGRRPDLVRRFRSERQILAALDHPAIAKLLDGGSLPDGTPYLVMEHVDGARIDDYCRQRQLPLRAKLELFLEVCAAVEAAHERLVVHRDIKPGNILVGADGRPKLLDFGIAKLLDRERLEITVAETELGRSPLTLRYASPEQVMGEPIGTTSDVYSLGVVLYELLAGRSPYGGEEQLSTAAIAALAGRICREEPPRPSSLVPGAKLEGDLDAIVGKALRKEPSARFGSAAALADDLRRHLDGFPVLARKGSRLYSAGKFVRRHRIALGAAVLLFATLSLTAVSSWRQASRLAEERDRVVAAERLTREKEESARQVTKFLVEILQEADPEKNQGREPSLREVLDRGAERVSAELAGQPAIEAPLLEAIGAVYEKLARVDRGSALLERAVELRRRNAAQDPLALADALSQRALLERTAGRLEPAQALFREALEIDRRVSGADHPRTARTKQRLGGLLLEMSRFEEAESLLEEVLRHDLAALGLSRLPLELEGRRVDASWDRLFRALFSRGNAANYRGRVAESLTYYDEAARLAGLIHGESHSMVAHVLLSRSGALLSLGRHEEALADADRALAIQRAVFGAEHPQVALVLVNRMAILGAARRWSEVEILAREAEAILAASVGEGHPWMFAVHNGLAEALAEQGRKKEALRLHREILVRRERLLGRKHESLVTSRANIGRLLLELGSPGEAAAELERGAAVAREILPAEHSLRLEVESLLSKAVAARLADDETVIP